jgi:hypothetical protein
MSHLGCWGGGTCVHWEGVPLLFSASTTLK